MDRNNGNARNVNENPCNMCMPMGAILPFKGIEESMVILHGSQGCSTYMRRHIAEHFNEPIDVGSSSLNEKGTIYGGEKNLKQALDNIIKVYNPKLIGVLTTCLAETIGEDVERITTDYRQERNLEHLPIIAVPTPGYGATHAEGYFLALRKTVEYLVTDSPKNQSINIIVPNISTADMRELKRIVRSMGISYTMFPDFSDTLDRPIVQTYKKVSDKGTKIADIQAMSGAMATIQFGVTVNEQFSPGHYLLEKFGVPLYNLPIPIGIENTDLFINTLQRVTGCEVPEELQDERGRLLDAMVDSHKYNFQGRSALFGDPEMVYAVTKTCVENGVFPVVIATGSKIERFAELLKPILADTVDTMPSILSDSDFVQIRQEAKQRGANIAVGHSDGRYLEEKEKIPLVRMGFPIHDRVGGQRILSVGYTGTTMFLDRITNTLLENKHKVYRSSMYEKFYRGKELQNQLIDS